MGCGGVRSPARDAHQPNNSHNLQEVLEISRIESG